jgi:hypothetical protein
VTGSSGGRQIFDVSNSGSYLAANDPRLLVGLGAAASAKVEIRWPSGKSQVLASLAADRYHQIKEK